MTRPFPHPRSPLPFSELVWAVQVECGVSRADLMGRQRHPTIVGAREMLWTAMRERTVMSYPDIAVLTRGRRSSHPTVVEGVSRFWRAAATDAGLVERLETVIARAETAVESARIAAAARQRRAV